jgi:ribosome-binding protein aMBF1 (putative translation factor)
MCQEGRDYNPQPFLRISCKKDGVSERTAQEIVRGVIGCLKSQRESLGWSQRALASRAGVDPKTVSVIERGIRSPTLFTLSLMASAMGVPLWKTMKDAQNKSKDAE